MCEQQPKSRSCTTCPKYDGMSCTAAGMLMGDREQVLQQEHRRGFICIDTGEAELKGSAVLQWTAEQERLRQEKGYKSCEEMWDAEGKQVKCGVRIDEDNEQLEPMLQVSNGSGSPSSECPSLREGPPQKGKIAQKEPSHNSQRLSITLKPEATCCNCNKSHYEGLRLVCDKWGLQDIKMPERPCEKWALDPEAGVSLPESDSSLSTTVDNASLPKRGTIVPGQGIQLMENPVPLWKDTNGYWEPVKPRSCTNCKLYNDPICMKIGTHIGTRAQIWQREDLDGFQCVAALPKEERYNVITSIGCNKRKENR